MNIKPTEENSMYLGDGVYATNDGYGSLILWTERLEGKHWMTLDSNALKMLDLAQIKFGFKQASE